MVNDPIHEQLRANRQAAGLSQAALAARMGTVQSVIARSESSRSVSHTTSFLERCARATGRPVTLAIVPEHPAPPSIEELHRLSRPIREAATALSIHHVRVVGSVAKGTARTDSDVDLLVKVSARLRGAAYFAALDEFREACTRITRRPVDVIDEAGVPDGATRRRLLQDARSL